MKNSKKKTLSLNRRYSNGVPSKGKPRGLFVAVQKIIQDLEASSEFYRNLENAETSATVRGIIFANDKMNRTFNEYLDMEKF